MKRETALEQALQDAIPKRIRQFSKIDPGKDPFYFDDWDIVKNNGEVILRYWFLSRGKTKKHRKRVFIAEMEALIRCACSNGRVTREDYEKHCPRTNKSGGCGFAVIIAILDFFRTVQRDGKEYWVTDQSKLRGLLGEQLQPTCQIVVEVIVV